MIKDVSEPVNGTKVRVRAMSPLQHRMQEEREQKQKGKRFVLIYLTTIGGVQATQVVSNSQSQNRI